MTLDAHVTGIWCGQIRGGVGKIRVPQYRVQNTIVLIMGTPKMVPIILGNPQIGMIMQLGLGV